MTTSIADIKRVFIDTSAWIDLMNSRIILAGRLIPQKLCSC